MLSLIMKDLLIIKRTILIGFAYMIFFLFAFHNMGNGAFITSVVALTYLLVMTATAYEDKNNTDIVINSLPIKRSEIILGKYLSVIIYLMIALAIFFIINYVFQIANIGIGGLSISSMEILMVAFSVSLLNGIYLPIYFKFGYIKTRILNMILLILMVSGTSTMVNLIQFDNNNQGMNSFSNFLKTMGQSHFSSLIMGLTLIIAVTSFTVSLTIYKNKEF